MNEFSDRTLDSHLITYINYLENDGIGQSKIKFLILASIPNDIASNFHF